MENGVFTYVLDWVKKNYKKYFRVCYPGKAASNTIYPFIQAAIDVDAKAFSKLMAHLR